MSSPTPETADSDPPPLPLPPPPPLLPPLPPPCPSCPQWLRLALPQEEFLMVNKKFPSVLYPAGSAK